MKVRIATYSLVTSEEECGIAEKGATQKTIDWNNASDRKWLTNHQHWAMNNNHAVLVRPIF